MAMGRPRKPIDEKQFRTACKIQCTLPEIADFFDCSEDTIERWCHKTYGISYADIHKRFSEGGKMSIRRMQFAIAEDNAAMAKWLGIQYLGQSDNPQLDEDSDTAQAIKNLSEVLYRARTKYGSGAASSPVEPEQAGAEHEGGSIPADAAPLSAAKQGRKSATKPSAKGKAPAKAVKSK